MTPIEQLHDDTADQPVPMPGPVTGISALTHLRDRREAIVQEQILERRVPRWSDPEIWVRYEPVDFDIADKVRKMSERSKGRLTSQQILDANIDALIAGCIGVYATLEGDERQFSLKPGEPEGPLTTFDADLAQNFGLPEGTTARQVVRTLFLTDGDILYHGQELSKFSGFAGEEANEQLGES